MYSYCICSLWGLSLFCFWNYSVECDFWSKTKKVIRALKTTMQFLQSHLYFCLSLGWKNPQEHCSQKRIPRTVHGDHYSYGVIALLATFGKPGVVTPVASIIPSILAKSSTVCNPIIYILMNKQVRSAILKLYFHQGLLGVLDFCVWLCCWCVLVRKYGFSKWCQWSLGMEVFVVNIISC